MPAAGRNEPCPCGSGKKYKRCCLAQDQAAALAPLLARQAEQAAAAAARRAQPAEYQAALAEADDLAAASNAVIDLIDAGRLDDAERAARALLVDYPEVHDGHDRLGMVYEARGMPRQAAECYRQVVAAIAEHPDHYDPEMKTFYLKQIAKLDPPAGD